MASTFFGHRRGHAPVAVSSSITAVTETEKIVETQESQTTVSSEADIIVRVQQEPSSYTIVHHGNGLKAESIEAITSSLGTSNLSTYASSTLMNCDIEKPVQISNSNTKFSVLPSYHAKGQRRDHATRTDKLIIGIDFGTTYTGIAYAFTSKPEDIVVIKEWGGKYATGRNDFLKVPSLIKYTSRESYDYTWGYHVDPAEPGAIRGIKLSLDPGKRDSYMGSRSPIDTSTNIIVQSLYNTERAHLDKGTIEIVSDYIGAAYKSALSQLRGQYMEGYVDKVKKEFTLTVPAIWSEEAKTSTLLAARKAHVDLQVLRPADLITEPEAAALYVFHAFSQAGFKKGDTFLLCDAGGGTVDLVSYKIKALAPKLELEQIVLPSGDAVGSMMLNNAFDKYLKDTLGEIRYKEFVESEDNDYHHAMEDFEKNIKTRFNGPEEWDEDGKRYSKISLGEMTIADDPEKNIRRGNLIVTGKTLFDIFDPLVTQIENLVTAQLKSIEANVGAATKSVFLVGGFGASQYLQKRLKNLVPESMKVTYPADAWAAVVRGAVLSKIPNVISVVATVAAKSYGIRSDVVFYDHEHTQEAARHKHWDDFENTWRITTMEWSVVKGQKLDRTQEWSVPFFRALPLDYTEDDLLFDCEFEQCDARYPPEYPWNGTLTPACKIECDFRHLQKDQLELFEPLNGRSHYLLNYELCVKPGAALSSFALKFNGELRHVSDMRFAAE